MHKLPSLSEEFVGIAANILTPLEQIARGLPIFLNSVTNLSTTYRSLERRGITQWGHLSSIPKECKNLRNGSNSSILLPTCASFHSKGSPVLPRETVSLRMAWVYMKLDQA